MKNGYLNLVISEPVKYLIMFGDATGNRKPYREMAAGACNSFSVLRASVTQIFEARGVTTDKELIDREAMFVWASLHGVISVTRVDAIDTPGLAPLAGRGFIRHALQKIGMALGTDVYRRAAKQEAE